MKSSILLKRKETFSKLPYASYIYDSIWQYYVNLGYQVKVGIPDGKDADLPEAAPILWVLDLPEKGLVAKYWWKRIAWPRLVRRLGPEMVYYLEPTLPVLKKTAARQWLFITDMDAFSNKKEQPKKVIAKRTAILRHLLSVEQSFIYAPTAITLLQAPQTDIVLKAPQVWAPYPSLHNGPLDWDEKEKIKEVHAGGHEYFLMDVTQADLASIVHYFKAFSHFKKWQKSNMQLLLFLSASLLDDPAFKEMFNTYYFRQDVQLLKRPKRVEDLYPILAAAYAVLEPSGRDDKVVDLLAAAQYGSLAVSIETPAVNAFLGEGLFPLPGASVSDLGQIMITIYKSEILRTRYIQAGLEKAKAFHKLDLDYWHDKFKVR